MRGREILRINPHPRCGAPTSHRSAFSQKPLKIGSVQPCFACRQDPLPAGVRREADTVTFNLPATIAGGAARPGLFLDAHISLVTHDRHSLDNIRRNVRQLPLSRGSASPRLLKKEAASHTRRFATKRSGELHPLGRSHSPLCYQEPSDVTVLWSACRALLGLPAGSCASTALALGKTIGLIVLRAHGSAPLTRAAQRQNHSPRGSVRHAQEMASVLAERGQSERDDQRA